MVCTYKTSKPQNTIIADLFAFHTKYIYTYSTAVRIYCCACRLLYIRQLRRRGIIGVPETSASPQGTTFSQVGPTKDTNHLPGLRRYLIYISYFVGFQNISRGGEKTLTAVVLARVPVKGGVPRDHHLGPLGRPHGAPAVAGLVADQPRRPVGLEDAGSFQVHGAWCDRDRARENERRGRERERETERGRDKRETHKGKNLSG